MGNAIKSNFVQLFRFGAFSLPSLFVLPYYPYFPFHQYTFDSFTGDWRIHIEGKDYSCRHKLRIVGNRKLLKPQSGSMCLLNKLRLPLLT